VTAAAAGAPVLADATGTRRRLQALVAIGWHRAELARRLHLGPSQFKALLRRRRVAAGTAAAVEALYDRIWDQWPGGACAERARRYAAALGWPVPMAWDEEDLDDPAAGPAAGWRRPARATWCAGDLAEDAGFIIATQGCGRALAAERLGVTKDALDQAFTRCKAQRAHTGSNQEELMTADAATTSRQAEAPPEPWTPHPDPRLAARGWHACDHGIWTRHADGRLETEREAG
jgi:hypothetical protein